MMNSQKRRFSGFEPHGVFQRHPFILVSVLCLMLLPLGFAQLENINKLEIVIEAVLWVLASSALIAMEKPSSKTKVNVYIIISSVLLAIIYSLFLFEDKSLSTVMFVPVGVGLLQYALVLRSERKLDTGRVIVLLLILAVVVRYCYLLNHNCTQMQHDVGSFDGKNGHAAYITYWYQNGLTLPDFDVTTRWQFYHPPLHHILMALGLHVFTFLGLPLDQAQEAVQILPMLYSAISMVACCRIFTLIRLRGAGLVAAAAVVCFYPTFIIWSGAYNNDMLATMFMLLAMLWTLKWYDSPRLRNILPIALCVGCGMMSKLSAWMVAPAIAMIFLWVFIRNIKKPLPFIGQFAAFGAVCAPLGLWWGIRNMITFDIPIAYVPDTKMVSMSVENISPITRLFDFKLFQFAYPFEAFTNYGAPYNEYNPLIGLVKTSVFDEYNIPWHFEKLPVVLVFAALILALVSLVFLVIWICKRKSGVDLPLRLFFAVIFVTIIVSYYIFCFQYPYVCTENIRYCIPVIPILAIGLGYGINAIRRALKPKL